MGKHTRRAPACACGKLATIAQACATLASARGKMATTGMHACGKLVATAQACAALASAYGRIGTQT
eukprot:6669989-Karenia_brevis.AAC.1